MADIKKPVKLRLDNLVECRRTLARVTNELYNTELDINTAKSLGFLISLILRALREDEIERRVEALEKELEKAR